MKKLILLILISTVVTQFFCTDSKNAKIIYSAEREIFKANKLMSNIAINPGAASQNDYDEALTKYKEIIEGFSNEKEEKQIEAIIGGAWMNIANLYQMQNDVKNAYNTYNEMIRRNSSDSLLCAKAQFSKGLLFERSGKLDTAYNEYKMFFQKYQKLLGKPEVSSPNFLEVPLKIARIARILDKKDFPQSYKNVRKFYFDLAKSHPDSQIVSTLYHLMATTYADLQDWNNSIDILYSLQSEYPDTAREPFILFEIANIYKNQLNKSDQALKTYDKILSKYPQHFLSANAQLQKGDIYLVHNEYQKARDCYETVVNNHKENITACSRAQFGIGITYEKSDQWEKAKNEFEWIWTKYPLSNEAMLVPNYIASHYKNKLLSDLANKWFKEAIKRYQEFYLKYPKHQLAPVSLLQSTVAYENLQQWDNAIQTLEKLLSNHNNSNVIPDVYLHLASIYENGKDQLGEALKFYEIFSERFPKHPLSEQVSIKISELKK